MIQSLKNLVDLVGRFLKDRVAWFRSLRRK
jgi:hypothetical protein